MWVINSLPENNEFMMKNFEIWFEFVAAHMQSQRRRREWRNLRFLDITSQNVPNLYRSHVRILRWIYNSSRHSVHTRLFEFWLKLAQVTWTFSRWCDFYFYYYYLNRRLISFREKKNCTNWLRFSLTKTLCSRKMSLLNTRTVTLNCVQQFSSGEPIRAGTCI